MTLNDMNKKPETDINEIQYMTAKQKLEYIKEHGHYVDPHELDIFFEPKDIDHPTKSEERTLDLIVAELMEEIAIQLYEASQENQFWQDRGGWD